MPAPVPHTCPTIDSVIEDIKASKVSVDAILSDFDYLTPNEIQTKLRVISSTLDSLYGSPRSDMEQIRTANEKLREWGSEGEETIDELKGEIYDLKEEIKQLESA